MSVLATDIQRNIKSWIYEAIGKGQSVINGLTKGDAQAELEVSRKNWIINGDHQINQRGLLPVTGATGSIYEATDRWFTELGGVTGDLSLVTAALPDGSTQNALRIEATGGGLGAIGFYQGIEDLDNFIGEIVTLSAWVRTNIPDYVSFRHYGIASYGVGHTGDGEWQLITTSFVCPTVSTNNDKKIGIISYHSGLSPASPTLTSGDYIEFTNVKLEIGDTATPFESRSEAEELALCERFGVELCSGVDNAGICHLAAYNTTTCFGVIHLPASMRGTATTELIESAASNFEVFGESGVQTASTVVLDKPSEKTVRVTVTGTFTQGSSYWLQENGASASLFVGQEL